MEAITGRAGRNRYAKPRASMRMPVNGAIYYGLGVTEHAQGSTTVMVSRTSRWPPATWAVKVGRESAAWSEQRAGFLRHGFVPA